MTNTTDATNVMPKRDHSNVKEAYSGTVRFFFDSNGQLRSVDEAGVQRIYSTNDALGTPFTPNGDIVATNVQYAIQEVRDEAQLLSEKNQPNGYCPLDVNSLIPFANIPPKALERMYAVADQSARFLLTTAQVQNGDTVKENDTTLLYLVVDETNLGNASGYVVYSAGTAVNVSGIVAVANGGTGASTAPGARVNLDVYSQGEVNSLINGSNLSFFLLDTVSDIGGYFVMNGASTNPESSVSVAINTNPTLIKAFATLVGEPNTTILKRGVYSVHAHAAKTGGTRGVSIHAEVYKRASGGTETLIGTSESSGILTGVSASYDLHLTIPSDITMLLTDRLVTKIYGVPSGGGSTPTATIYMEGDTASRLEVFITTEAYDARYFVKNGLPGGQVASGGLNASDNLTLSSTTHSTKGKILFGNSAYDEVNNRLGVGIVTPTSKLHVNGSFASRFTNVSANYPAADEAVIFCDDTLANITVTLPDATTCIGREYVIKSIGTASTFHTSIQGTGGQLVEGVALFEMFAGNMPSTKFKNNGTNWYLI